MSTTISFHRPVSSDAVNYPEGVLSDTTPYSAVDIQDATGNTIHIYFHNQESVEAVQAALAKAREVFSGEHDDYRANRANVPEQP